MSRVLISLPEELLNKVDTYCRDNHYLRSEFIRYILRTFLEPENELGEIDPKNENPQSI